MRRLNRMNGRIAGLAVVSIALAGCEAQMAALSGRQSISPGDFADRTASPNVSANASKASTFVDSDADLPQEVALDANAAEIAAVSDQEVERDEEAMVESKTLAPVAASPPPSSTSNSTSNASGSSGNLTAQPATPITTPNGMPQRVGQRVIVDSLIGQVNGRPIFADEFFEPIEDQILAARAQLPPDQFLATMEQIIENQLRTVIFNELVLAEAETLLTEEQRVGLRYWLKSEEEKRLAKSLGVRARAEEELAAEGLTIDEYLAIREDEAKIYTLIQQKIEPHVIVTWRDMEREYERRIKEFQPPASVTFSKIVLNREREAAMVEQVESGLASGKSFAEIGSSLERSSAFSEDSFQLGPGGIAALPLNPKIIEALKDLDVGETTAPVDIEIGATQPGATPRTTVYWYHIKSIDQSEARTLYDPDVQRELYAELYRRRSAEEQDRYLNSLLGKGIYDDRAEMSLRLRRIALIRYGRAQ